MSMGTQSAQTRSRVIQAAIETVSEIGYYRATSNEIARRAGVTWGTIQHHFGNRERLMYEVFEDACDGALQRMRTSVVVGDTVEERLVSLQDIVYDFYGKKSYTAVLQIIWNLNSDPDSSDEVVAALSPVVAELDREFRRLAAQVSPAVTDEFADFCRRVTWGLAVNIASQAYLFGDDEERAVLNAKNREYLSRSLASLLAGTAAP